jgi:hypothetical protein
MIIVSLIGFLMNLSSLVFMGITTLLMRKRKYITYDIKTGEACYKCKEKIPVPDGYWMLDDTKKKRTLCASCKRGESLDYVLEKRHLDIDYTSDKFRKIGMYFSLVAIVLNSISIWIKVFAIFGGICLLTSVWMQHKYQMSTTVPRTEYDPFT